MAVDCHVKPHNVAILLYIVGFLDLFAVSLVLPMFSQHARELGASPAVAGMIGSIYGGIQMFSGPLVGRWSDMSGRRHVLVVCLLLSALSYALLSISTTLFIWCLSRILTGMFKHTQELSQAYVMGQMPKTEHIQMLGRLNAISIIGYTVGPVIGGHMSEACGFYAMAVVTAAIFGFNVVLVHLMLPEVKKDIIKDEETENSKKPQSFHPLHFLESFRQIEWTNLWDIFLFRFCMGCAMLLYQSNFAMILDYKYGASPKIIGYLISYSGVVTGISSFFVKRVASFYTSDRTLLLHTAVLQLVTLIALTVAPSLWILAICLTPLNLASAVARVCSINVTIARGSGQEMGALLGIGASILSLARMISPALGGFAQEVHMSGPAMMATLVAALAVGILVVTPEHPPTAKKDL